MLRPLCWLFITLLPRLNISRKPHPLAAGSRPLCEPTSTIDGWQLFSDGTINAASF